MSKPTLIYDCAEHTEKDKHVSVDKASHRRGTAQYNFVPVNDIVFHYKSDNIKNIRHDVFVDGLNSGELVCELTTLSEVFVSNGDDNFFSIDGKPRIPGSSIRGLIRNMVNIMTFGKMTQIDTDRSLFTRPMADEDRLLRSWYNDELTEQKRGEKRKSYTANAGYLFHNKKEGMYYIQPAEEREHKQYTQIKIANMRRELHGQRIKEFEYYRRTDGSYYVTAGPAPKKKREWHIYSPDFNKNPVHVPIETILNYEKDCKQANPSRTIKFNLLETLKKRKNEFKNGIPVIYKVRDNKVVAFGHTGLFRIAYNKSIGEHLTLLYLDPKKIDLAERMFGRIAESEQEKEGNTSNAHASFIQVSDALPIEDIKVGIEKKVILSGPKPTSFQNYLVQTHTNKDGKNHWGQGTLLRGAKMYWHHPFKLPDYSTVKSEKMYTKMKPIAEGNAFTFNIRFNNLTDIELGALISAVQLPDGCAHKLGMAKALGLGSVRIEAKLSEVIMQERYNSIFDGDTWQLGEVNAEMEDFASVFRGTIAKYASEYDKDKNSGLYWDLYRMRQLKKMLSVEAGERAMEKGELNDQGYETRKRKILPIPTDV